MFHGRFVASLLITAATIACTGTSREEPKGPPTYAMVTLRHDATHIQMVGLMETFSDAQCDAAIREYMAGFEADPSAVEWRETERSCQQNIADIYQRVMRKEVFHATYIAFSPASRWDYEARIVLFGIPSTQAQEICQQVAKDVRNRYGVQTECIQGTIG